MTTPASHPAATSHQPPEVPGKQRPPAPPSQPAGRALPAKQKPPSGNAGIGCIVMLMVLFVIYIVGYEVIALGINVMEGHNQCGDFSCTGPAHASYNPFDPDWTQQPYTGN